MSRIRHQHDRAGEDTFRIGIRPESAFNNERPCLHAARHSSDRSEDCFVSRVVCDTTPEAHETLEDTSNVEAHILNEVADYLQSSHCDDFWRPKRQASQQVRLQTTRRQFETDANRLFFRPLSSSCSSGTSNILLLHPQVVPRTSTSYYTRLPSNYSLLATPSIRLRQLRTFRSLDSEENRSRSRPCAHTHSTASSRQPVTTPECIQKLPLGPTYTMAPRSKSLWQRLSAPVGVADKIVNIIHAFREAAGQTVRHHQATFMPRRTLLRPRGRALLPSQVGSPS